MNENRITIRIDDGKFYVFKLCADGMLKLADRHDLKTMFERPVQIDQVSAYHRPQP